jgi:hypothetical protein
MLTVRRPIALVAASVVALLSATPIAAVAQVYPGVSGSR